LTNFAPVAPVVRPRDTPSPRQRTPRSDHHIAKQFAPTHGRAFGPARRGAAALGLVVDAYSRTELARVITVGGAGDSLFRAASQRHPDRISEVDRKWKLPPNGAESSILPAGVMGTRTRTRGDRGRSRTVERIKRGGGDWRRTRSEPTGSAFIGRPHGVAVCVRP
jgi:hypothetical protein